MNFVYIKILEKMKQLEKYELLGMIGSGCIGVVFEARHKKTQQKVALKRIEKVGNQLSRQYQILLMIKDCENVIKIKDFFYSKNQKQKLIQNIIFQFVDDNLESLIIRNIKMQTRIPEKTIKNYMYQLLNGLKQIHHKNIAHRDLKPQNVLISNQGIIKICDFGSSKVIDLNGKNSPFIVPRYYRAPELSLCITKYNTSVDIWAAGCIMAQLFLLTPIFKGKSQGDQLFSIFKVLGSFSDAQKKELEMRVPFSTDLFQRFGHFQRIDLSNLFYMIEDRQNFLDLLLKMLQYLPQNRISAQQALAHPFFSDTQPQTETIIVEPLEIDDTAEQGEKNKEMEKELEDKDEVGSIKDEQIFLKDEKFQQKRECFLPMEADWLSKK